VNLPKIDSDLNIQMGGQAFDSSNTPITYDGIGWTVRGYNIHSETGLVIFLDVLGMKGIWKILPPIVALPICFRFAFFLSLVIMNEVDLVPNLEVCLGASLVVLSNSNKLPQPLTHL
jgi:hypothetical protein